jgi:competence protein ComEC
VVDFHAGLEPGWRIPTPPLWLGIAMSLALLSVAAASSVTMRRIAGAAVAVLLVLLVWHPFAPELRARELELSIIDVGQGDGLFLAFPDGKTMLVDGGGIPVFGRAPRSNMDIGEDVIAPYLWDRGIRHVDVIAISHAHEDHAGGVPALVRAFRPSQMWTGFTPEDPVWQRVRDAATRAGTPIRPLRAPSRFAFGGTQIEVLAPSADYEPAEIPKNNDSLVLRITYGWRSFLLTGDIERLVERAIVDGGGLGPADVLKVPHHGSRTSTTEEFLEAAHPAFAVISAGFENSYGHPHAAVIDRLHDRHTELLRTDRNGMVTVRTDGRRLTVDSYR